MQNNTSHTKTFSIGKRARSFSNAFKGIGFLFRSQHNAWIHALITILVVIGGAILGLNSMEWCIIAIAIGMVFGAELMNTAIELIVNKISPVWEKTAGTIKDVAAGAVLFTAIGAAVAGTIIFLPKIITLVYVIFSFIN